MVDAHAFFGLLSVADQPLVGVIDVAVFLLLVLDAALVDQVAETVIGVAVVLVMPYAVARPGFRRFDGFGLYRRLQKVEVPVVVVLAHQFFPALSFLFGAEDFLCRVVEQAVARGVELVGLAFEVRLAGFDESSGFVVAVVVLALKGVDLRQLAGAVVMVVAVDGVADGIVQFGIGAHAPDALQAREAVVLLQDAGAGESSLRFPVQFVALEVDQGFFVQRDAVQMA